jgi:hypothetical protein
MVYGWLVNLRIRTLALQRHADHQPS